VARVLVPGPLSSVQGSPRHGLAASGVPAGGAMDLASLAAANALVGNSSFAAALEVTLGGLELELLADARVAVAGGELELSVDGRKLEGMGPHQLRAADRLKLSAVSRGLRAYLAVDRGLAEPLPGEPSRPLKRGDELVRAARSADAATPRPPRIPVRLGEGKLEIRAVPGPQLEHFTEAARAAFFATEYSLSPQSDRRGLRLLGPPLELSRPSDIPSEGTAPGAVQVPGDGKPIVLGPDRPVTGGYAKIATVISADLPLLAQARPGAKIRFRAATLREALAAR
jgi:antagonist of KipI